ncbi:MAG: hypothetical protein BWY75_00768 [bacterium ADurb.Bin425]|nr:MAG: hypothetical protein BWY75_00768 [bacterium ADurb.Bin425]
MDHRFEAAFKSSASWFFWMAGCTVVNLFMVFTKSNFGLALGMSDSLMMAFVNLLKPPSTETGALIAFGGVIASNVLYIALMAVFGIFAGKGKVWAYSLGLSLALVDGIFCLLGNEWIGTAVHGMAVWFIFQGLRLAIAVRNTSPEELIFTASATAPTAYGGPVGATGSGMSHSHSEEADSKQSADAGDRQTDNKNKEQSKESGPSNPIS